MQLLNNIILYFFTVSIALQCPPSAVANFFFSVSTPCSCNGYIFLVFNVYVFFLQRFYFLTFKVCSFFFSQTVFFFYCYATVIFFKKNFTL